MSDNSIYKTLDVEKVTPRRILNSRRNTDLGSSDFYDQLNEKLKELARIDLESIFGDIIFDKSLLDELYVLKRENPSTIDLAGNQGYYPFTMDDYYKQLYSDNEIVYHDGEEYQNLTTKFIKVINKLTNSNSNKALNVLNIVYNSNKSRISRLLIIIGSIGNGKTTFLVHFFANHLDLNRIWFDFNFFDNTVTYTRESLLRRMKDIIEQIIGSTLGEFDFRKGLFSKKIKQNEAFFLKNGRIDKNRLNQKMQEWIDDPNVFVIEFIRYEVDANNAIVVFDNIDIHNNRNQVFFYEFSKELLSDIEKLKIIMTMREYTFSDLRNEYNGALSNQPIMHITSPNIIDIIDKRIEYISNRIGKGIPFHSESIKGSNIEINVNDFKAFLEKLLKPLKNMTSLELQKNISNLNVRNILLNQLNYLKSKHLLRTRYIIDYMTEDDVFFYKGKITFDDFLRITLQRTWKYYEPRIYESQSELIFNLYQLTKNSFSKYVFLDYRILCHVLGYYKNCIKLTKKELIHNVSQGLFISEFFVENSISKFLIADVLESPDGKNNTNSSYIFPTRKTWYYIHKLSKYLVYINTIRFDSCFDFVISNEIDNTYDENTLKYYLHFIDWIRRMEKEEVNMQNTSSVKYYNLLLTEVPISLKLFKSFIKRSLSLVEGNYIDKKHTIFNTNIFRIKSLFNQIERDIKSGKILPKVDEVYLKNIGKLIKSLEKLSKYDKIKGSPSA